MEKKEGSGASNEISCDITSKNEKDDLEAPQDKFYVIYILFFFLGLVHLLPWSFFTTATEFWMYKFRNTSINETNSEFRTDLQAQFNATVMITLQVSEVAFLFVGVLWGRLISVRVRMIGIFTIIFTFFVILTIFVKVDTDSWQSGFFGMVMAITAGINSMNSVFTITMYTTLASFPQHYLAPYLTGTGLSKAFTSVLQILTLASGLSVQNSALLYFCLGLFIIAITLVGLVATGRNQFYLYHMRNYQVGQIEKRVSFREGRHLLTKIWPSVAMMGLFVLTTNASPTALVVSEDEGSGLWSDIYFIPTITFLLAAICDLIGRGIGYRYAPNVGGHWWVIFAAARLAAFIPLNMLCNAQPRNHLPVLLPHDYQYIIIVIAANISGGYMLSRSSYNIANFVSKEELKHAYHVNMLFTGLQMGIFSFISIVSVKLL